MEEEKKHVAIRLVLDRDHSNNYTAANDETYRRNPVHIPCYNTSGQVDRYCHPDKNSQVLRGIEQEAQMMDRKLDLLERMQTKRRVYQIR